MRLNNLKDLYVHELRDLYNAECRLSEALPRMAEHASSDELRRTITDHHRETEEHRTRLEQIIADLGEKPRGERCEAMDGLLKECEEILGADGEADAIDAGIIAMGNRIEHYEIAGYGAARTHARELGLDEHARLLQRTLDEEGEADRKLTGCAHRSNAAAT